MDLDYVPAHVPAIVKDYAGFRTAPFLSFTIGGVDFSGVIDSVNWGWGDGAAILLKASLATRLPSDMQGDEVILSLTIGGYTEEMFVSRQMRFDCPDDDWRSEVLATTAGGLADKVTLEENLELTGWAPHLVVWNAVHRLPYDQSRVRIHKIETPLIVRTGPDILNPEDTTFDETETVSDVVGSLGEEISFIEYDSARGYHFEQDPGIGTGLPIIWEYQRNSDEIISWPMPRRVDPDKEYSKVVVLAKNEDGSDRIRKEWPVHHAQRNHPPLSGQVLYIDFSDESVDADTNAARLAFSEADRAGKGLHEGSADVVLNPFIKPGRVVGFTEDYRDSAGVWSKRWLCIIKKGVTHDDTGGKMMTSFDYSALKLEETLVQAPAAYLQGISPPFITSNIKPILKPFAFRDIITNVLTLDKRQQYKPYFAKRDNSNGFYFIPANSGGIVGRDNVGRFYIKLLSAKQWLTWGDTGLTIGELDSLYPTIGDIP